MSIDEILINLQEHRQRVTPDAIAGILGIPCYLVLKDRLYSHLTSWVVNPNTHLPTDFSLDDQHPYLEENKHVIWSSEELRKWLEAHPCVPGGSFRE